MSAVDDDTRPVLRSTSCSPPPSVRCLPSVPAESFRRISRSHPSERRRADSRAVVHRPAVASRQLHGGQASALPGTCAAPGSGGRSRVALESEVVPSARPNERPARSPRPPDLPGDTPDSDDPSCPEDAAKEPCVSAVNDSVHSNLDSRFVGPRSNISAVDFPTKLRLTHTFRLG